MFQCAVCDTRWDLTKEQWDLLWTCLKEEKTITAETKCPHSKCDTSAFVVGAEPDADWDTGKPCINMFTRKKN